MADTGNTERGRSVVVAVSGFGDLRPAFRQAARLAASLNADLAALLVEDESLRRMAALPFVQQVSLATARSLPMAASDLDREFRAFAHLAERMIAEVAREAGIAGRIQTARGQLAASVRTAVRPGDLVMICTTSSFGAGGGRRHLAESILAQLSDCDLLLQSPRPEATRSIAVCDDGTEAGKRAIDTAAALARAYGSELTVIDVDHQARELPSHISLRRRSDRDLEMVRSVLRQETPAMLILPAGLADRIDSELLVETTGCAVLIVR